MRNWRKERRSMNRVIVKCKNRKPERVFDISLEEKGEVFVEMKFPDSGQLEKINITEYLSVLGVILKKDNDQNQ